MQIIRALMSSEGEMPAKSYFAWEAPSFYLEIGSLGSMPLPCGDFVILISAKIIQNEIL